MKKILGLFELGEDSVGHVSLELIFYLFHLVYLGHHLAFIVLVRGDSHEFLQPL